MTNAAKGRGDAVPTGQGLGSRPLAAGLVLLLLLGACATAEPEPEAVEPRSQIYQGLSREAVFERTLAALQASGLRIESAERDRGAITAVGRVEERGWAECPWPLTVVEGNDERGNRLVRIPLPRREVEMAATVRDVPGGDGVELTLRPAFIGYPASAAGYRGASPEPCRSTGALERRIFQAVAREA